MGAQVENQRQPNEGLELYFTQQPDYIRLNGGENEKEKEKNAENMRTDGKKSPLQTLQHLHKCGVNQNIVQRSGRE